MSSGNSNDDDDVFQLLDELDTVGKDKANSQGESKNTRDKDNGKADKDNQTKSSNNDESDILGFLDSLTQEQKDQQKQKAASPPKRQESPPAPAPPPVIPSQPEQQQQPTSEKETTSAAISENGNEQSTLGGVGGQLSSWWSSSGIWNTAQAAVKEAEARMQEIRGSEDAKRWTEQLKATSSNLNRLNLSQKLASTFNTVLTTIAPPIASHEQLRIHIFHDMVGYPSVERIVYAVFERVMEQVEGGDLVVIQSGGEHKLKGADAATQQSLNLFDGTMDQAAKLAKANVGNVNKGKEHLEGDNEQEIVRKSDIYVSIQPFAHEDKFGFSVYLTDPANDLNFSTPSQLFPRQWADWLEGQGPNQDSKDNDQDLDPQDWVIDWIEEGLGLSLGVLAQQYVAARMGVGIVLADDDNASGEQ